MFECDMSCISVTVMDEEMITLHNIMPVELAIKREMEYRTKLDARRLINLNPLLPSQSDFCHPFIFIFLYEIVG